MAKISLRAYNREIENLIERGQTSEAIGHCKNILRYYPKHLETYRLLGKAYLEAQRFAEAADILQRLLAAVPDDFIAQLGMSIIREDEGNFDASIWHMERSFEVQPANGAIQAELRRLYGRRDGVEPPRIRLTRGALVRMYVRGQLYPQAIAEIRSALAEDPKRTDLEAILAGVYFASGKKVEATEICGRLVSKFPYCFEACQILADILPSTSKAEDAKIYQARIEAMDPYIAHLSPNALTSQDVPEQAIQLERIDWQPITETKEQPAWTSAIGVNWEAQEEDQPDWLTSAIPGPSSGPFSQPPTTQTASSESNPEFTAQIPDADLPDFLASAGWTASSGDATAFPETQLAGEDQVEETGFSGEQLESANIPDWLQAMAPQQATSETPEDNSSRTALLESLFGSSAEETPATPAAEAATPDWLSSLGQETAPEQTTPAAEAATPDWLSSLGQETAPEQTTPAAEAATPDWLSSLGQETTPEQTTPAAEAATPDWLSSLGQETTPEQTTPAAEAATPDWLSSLGQETAPEQTTPAAEAATPDWLSSLGQETAPEQTTPAAEAATPDWLSSLGQETTPEQTTPAAEAATPDWLSSLGQETTPEQTTPAAEAATPDWLSSLGQETAQEQPPIIEQPVAETPAAAAPGAESDIDSALAWLESLAVKQGADADFLLVEPDKRTEKPPEWVETATAEAQSAPAPTPTAEAPVEQEPLIQQPVAEQPLEQTPIIEQPVAETPAAAAPGAESDIDSALAWLESLAVKQGADADFLLVEPDKRTEKPPEWVETATAEAQSAPAPTPTAEAPVEQEPLIQQPVAEQPLEQTPIIEQPVAETPAAAAPGAEFDIDSALAWLESLAVKQGADADFLLVEPDKRTEKPPEWVETATAEAQSAPAPTPAAEAPVEQEPLIQQPVAEQPLEQAPIIEQPVAETPAAAAPGAESDIDSALAWLESLAVKQGADADFLLVEPDKRTEKPPEWVETATAEAQSAPAPTPTAEAPVEQKPLIQQPVAEQPLEQTPIIEQPVAETPAAAAPGAESDIDSALAWLESLAVKQGADADFLLVEPDKRTEKPPEWVETATAEAQSAPAPTPTAEAPVEQEPLIQQPVAEQPLEQTPIIEQPVAETPAAAAPGAESDIDSALAWLESLAVKQGADADFLLVEPDKRTEKPPEWVETATAEAQSAPAPIPAAEAPVEQEPLIQQPVAEQPLEQTPIIEQPVAETPTAAAPGAEFDIDSALAWLESLAVKQGADADFLLVEPDKRTEKPPEWVETATAEAQSAPAPTPTAEAPVEQEPLIQQPVAEQPLEQTPIIEQPVAETPAAAAPGTESDIDSALAWLESLAVKQGADADFLLVEPDKRTEKPPEWVETATAEAQSAPAPIPAAEAPVEQEPLIQQPVAEQPDTPTIPDWLSGIDEPNTSQTVPSAPDLNQGVDITQPTMLATGSIDIAPESEKQPEITLEEKSDANIPDWIKAGAQAEEEIVELGLPPEWSETPVQPIAPEPVADEGWLTGLTSEEPSPATTEQTAWIIEEVTTPPINPQPIPVPETNPMPVANLEDPNAVLEVAQRAMYSGDLDTAIPLYGQLIENGKLLEEVIHDLRDALYRYPIDISIWQALGDAYARNNLLQEALDAYTKAEELLR